MHDAEGYKNEKKEGRARVLETHAIFSDGDLHGTSSSTSSSLSSPSSSALSVEMLSAELVNMSGTGRMLGLRLPGDSGVQGLRPG